MTNSVLGVRNIQHTNGTDAMTIQSDGRVVPVMAGSIIQMQYSQYTGTTSQAITADTDTVMDFISVNITPVSTSSKIHIQTHIFYEHGDNNNNSWNHVWFFYRDSTKLAHPAAGSRQCGISVGTLTYYADDNNSTAENARYDYFDEPNTTSQITYKIGYRTHVGETLYINRTAGDTNSNGFERGVSMISVTEIAG